MGNNLRCCLACILPCGALDLIRIVHINGHVEEYSRPVSAREILEANPNHVISRPCSQGVSHRIMIVSPDSELKRGHIYFLIPASALPERKKKSHKKKHQKGNTKPVKVPNQDNHQIEKSMEKKKSGHRQRKSDRVAAWRPHLESIYEDL